MKIKVISIMLLLCILAASASACISPSTSKPTATPTLIKPLVSYVPPGWILSADNPPAPDAGFIEYASNSDYVMIWYYKVPDELKNSDSSALISYATTNAPFTPTETGTTQVNGHLAGYASTYDIHGFWLSEIVYVNGGTCVEINAAYVANNTYNVNNLINSIQ